MMPPPAKGYPRTVVTCVLFPILLSSCGAPPFREAVTPTQAHMYAHFDRAGEVHDALVRGELDRAKVAGEWIASHPEPRGLTDVPEAFLFAMQGYATQVSQSNRLEEAATAAAHLGRTCGDCHREQAIEPRFLVGTAPPSGDGPKAEMARHIWASERMWEGLVGPGDHAWRSGAEALKQGWLDPHDVASDPGDRERIGELIRQVYALGTQAERASDSGERAEIYGEFLNTCTECHRLTAAYIR